MAIYCGCSTTSADGAFTCTANDGAATLEEDDVSENPDVHGKTVPLGKRGLVAYWSDPHVAFCGAPLRSGTVCYVNGQDGTSYSRAVLSLHTNGFHVKHVGSRQAFSVVWSPFSQVQACRFHSVEADASVPDFRLFKVYMFQHGSTHIFATFGKEADQERAHWLADVSRSVRGLTRSLFPPYSIRTDPLPGVASTASRLLAGFLLLSDESCVTLVYAELHSQSNGCSQCILYEDEYCENVAMIISIWSHTRVSERVGVDCSCFNLAGIPFAARTCAEKTLWIRAISNVKVKMRHGTQNPSSLELEHYRAAIREHVERLGANDEDFAQKPLLPRCKTRTLAHRMAAEIGNTSDRVLAAARGRLSNQVSHATSSAKSSEPFQGADAPSDSTLRHQPFTPPRRPLSVEFPKAVGSPISMPMPDEEPLVTMPTALYGVPSDEVNSATHKDSNDDPEVLASTDGASSDSAEHKSLGEKGDGQRDEERETVYTPSSVRDVDCQSQAEVLHTLPIFGRQLSRAQSEVIISSRRVGLASELALEISGRSLTRPQDCSSRATAEELIESSEVFKI
mmetsp:Transcript_118353/g.334431  ORF Transcript_118353/g.334431 Transcript_118353/m.334431 type:complete len:566 (-) Transcript_118353:89-1786(-)